MKYLVNVLLLLPFSLLAQTPIHGIVTDKHRIPLPLTNIVSLTSNSGGVTNNQGNFSIPISIKTDSIKFSNIAYLPKTIAIKDLKDNDTIVLEENIEQMKVVVLKDFSHYKQEATLGFKDYPNNGEYKFGPGDQIATYIDNKENKDGWIKGIFFKVKAFGKCTNTMRVRLLEMDTITFRPSTDLLDENNLISSSDLKKTNYVDVSNNKIIIPKEGIFIVLEWVYQDNNCDKNSYTSIAANLSLLTNVVWFNFRDRVWKIGNSPGMISGNYMTPNVALKIAY